MKRASELEKTDSPVPSPTMGPTLAEVEQIAGEAGMDPALVRRAAQELDSGGQRRPFEAQVTAVLGAPLGIELVRTVAGKPTSEDLVELLSMVQRAADGQGNPSILGNSFHWRSSDSNGTRVMEASVDRIGEETRLLVRERYQALAGGLFGGLVGGIGCGVGFGVGMGVGLGALGSVAFASIFPPVVLGLSFVAARTIFQTSVMGRKEVLERLMEDMVRTGDQWSVD